MKNYKDSDYAINKYKEGIVYKFADGIVEVTLEDYLRENPDKQEEDFIALKRLSDEIYHQQIIQEHRTSRLDESLDAMEDKDSLVVISSAEEEVLREYEEEEVLKAAKKLLESRKLTLVQERRFYLYFLEGLSTRQIARLEGVHQRAVWDSLMWAEKKFKKLFEE